MSYRFSCNKDKEEFKKVFEYNLRLLCGKNYAKMIEVRNKLNSSITSIEIIPNMPNNYLDSRRRDGETKCNALNGTSEILMKGYLGAPEYKYDSIQHTFSHEISHAIYCIMNRSQDRVNSNGNIMHWIGKCNGEKFIGGGGTLVSIGTKKRYGKLFEETLMDIRTSIGLAEFDENYQARNPGVTADTILNKNINKWSNNTYTGYSTMTSITRLMIAAFSNEPNINYHYWIQRGEPIDTIKCRRLDGSIMYANDFLYGMMYDPIHIMEEYDKYMGEGAYLELLKSSDKIYAQAINATPSIDRQEVKALMKNIAHFANLRTSDLKQRGVFSSQDITILSGQFNKIWNSMLGEYGISIHENELE